MLALGKKRGGGKARCDRGAAAHVTNVDRDKARGEDRTKESRLIKGSKAESKGVGCLNCEDR